MARAYRGKSGLRDYPAAVDLIDVVGVVLRRWPLILLVAILGGALALAAALLVKPESVARLEVAPLPASEDALTATQDTRAGFNISSILGPKTSPQVATYFSTLKSMEVIAPLIKQQAIAPLLFPDQWDATTKTWKHPQGLWSDFAGAVKTFLNLPPALAPDDPTVVHDRLAKILTFNVLDKDLAPSIYEVEVKLRDPAAALQVLTLLHQEALTQIRQRETAQAAAVVAVLHKLYSQTQVQDYRQTLTQMMANQEQKYLLLQDPAYPVVVQVVDAPAIIVPPHRSLSLWVGGGAALGILAAIALIVILWLRSLPTVAERAPADEREPSWPPREPEREHAGELTARDPLTPPPGIDRQRR